MQYHWNIFLFVIAVLNLGITGCYKKSSDRFSLVSQEPTEIQPMGQSLVQDDPQQKELLAYYQETKAADVPLPFGAQLITKKSDIAKDGASFYVTYSVTDSKQEIRTFYDCQMERYGWSREGMLDARDLLILYAKPRRRVIIMIKESDNPTVKVTLYYMLKANNSDQPVPFDTFDQNY